MFIAKCKFVFFIFCPATYDNSSFSQYYLKSLDTDTFELVRQLAKVCIY